MIVIALGYRKFLEEIKGVKIINFEKLLYTLYDGWMSDIRALDDKTFRKLVLEAFEMIKEMAKKFEKLIIVFQPQIETINFIYPILSFPMFKYFIPDYIIVLDHKYEDDAKIISYITGIPYRHVEIREDLSPLGIL